MRAEYDFSTGKRGALIARPGKTRISIFVDNAVLDAFRARAGSAGVGYQTMINDALKAALVQAEPPVTESGLRAVLSEFLPQAPAAGPARRKRAAGAAA